MFVKPLFEPQNTCIFLKTASFLKISHFSLMCHGKMRGKRFFLLLFSSDFPEATTAGKGFHKLVVLPNHIAFASQRVREPALAGWCH